MSQSHITSQNASISAGDQSKYDGHPILRCPADILKTIFECTVAEELYFPKSHKLRSPKNYEPLLLMALSVSQVCRDWRTLSLETPRLWSVIFIDCTISRSLSDVQWFWRLMDSRVKNAPSIVCIYLLAPNFPYQGIELFRVPANIRDLRIFLSFTMDYNLLLELLGSGRAVRELWVGAKPQLDDPIWDFGALLGRLRNAYGIYITAKVELHINTSLVYPSLRRLKLSFASHLDILRLLSLLPQLEDLSLYDIFGFITSTSQRPVTLPHLATLYFHIRPPSNTSYEWLSKLASPNLREVSLTKFHLERGIIQFLSTHQHTLQSLTVRRYEASTLGLFESAVPKLKELRISFKRSHFEELCMGIFRHLRTVTLMFHEDSFGEPMVEEFDWFVQTRCLPSSHPQSQLVVAPLSPLEELEMLVEAREYENCWLQSSLIGDAKYAEIDENGASRLSWLD